MVVTTSLIQGNMLSVDPWPSCNRSFSLKHVMVFTMSGKPVWSRYGSEETNSALVGILFTIYSILDETDDQIGEIELGQGRRLVYFISDPIILVSIGFGQTRQLRNELSIGIFGTRAGIHPPEPVGRMPARSAL